MERPQVDHAAEGAERMPVGLPDPPPVRELDAELVGCLRVADEISLVDVEETQQIDDGRDGGLAHAHRADVRRLDHRDHVPVPGSARARMLAAIQPAVPPPTIAMRLIG